MNVDPDGHFQRISWAKIFVDVISCFKANAFTRTIRFNPVAEGEGKREGVVIVGGSGSAVFGSGRKSM